MARLRRGLLAAGFRVAREHGAALASGPDFVRFVAPDGALLLGSRRPGRPSSVSWWSAPSVTPSGLRVATVEDLIVRKLIADRPKDQGDLHGLGQLPGVDWSYVERWAGEWGVSDRLERLRKSA